MRKDAIKRNKFKTLKKTKQEYCEHTQESAKPQKKRKTQESAKKTLNIEQTI